MSDMNEKNLKFVNGFIFENTAEARQAKKEEEGVKYIGEKVNMDDPETVLQIYNKMVQQELFETAIGYTYLKNLQEYLLSIPFIEKKDILPIEVKHPALEQNLRNNMKVQENAQAGKVRNTDYKKSFQIAVFFSVILTVCVVAMFAITATTNNVTILDYETKLINKYEAWEQELMEREEAVSVKEEELGIGDN